MKLVLMPMWPFVPRNGVFMTSMPVPAKMELLPTFIVQPSSLHSLVAVSMASASSALLMPTCAISRPSISCTAEEVRARMRSQSLAFTASPGTIQLPPQQMILLKER